MIAALICFFKGHKHGKRSGPTTNGMQEFRCPRCGELWTRKAKTSPPQSASS